MGNAVERFRDDSSAEREILGPALARLLGLSREMLNASLEAMLQGVARAPTERLSRRVSRHGCNTPVLVVLAGNVPALSVQPLLPALLLRVPVLLKSASAEPLFAPAFVEALTRREPLLKTAIAAVTWQGGDASVEELVLRRCRRVVAYGADASLTELRRRARGRLVEYGSKLSLAVVGREVDPKDIADGLARDIALFEQRGCLSIQSVISAGEARDLADALALALRRYAAVWPPGPCEPGLAAAVQQLRTEGLMRGLYQPTMDLEAGTVVVESEARISPSPGLRTVRIHAVEDLATLPLHLEAWSGRLQGVALAGGSAWALEPELSRLGVSRTALPGELQLPDACWPNSGHDPLAVFL